MNMLLRHPATRAIASLCLVSCTRCTGFNTAAGTQAAQSEFSEQLLQRPCLSKPPHLRRSDRPSQLQADMQGRRGKENRGRTVRHASLTEPMRAITSSCLSVIDSVSCRRHVQNKAQKAYADRSDGYAVAASSHAHRNLLVNVGAGVGQL
jgi:hypothetical protein